jgi:hypothetical protein
MCPARATSRGTYRRADHSLAQPVELVLLAADASVRGPSEVDAPLRTSYTNAVGHRREGGGGGGGRRGRL